MAIAQYANDNPELLGIAPAVAGLITAGITAGTTIAALVAGRVQQKRAGSQQTSAQAHELKLAEIAAKAKAAAKDNTMLIAGAAAIPIGILLVMKLRDRNKKAGGKRK